MAERTSGSITASLLIITILGAVIGAIVAFVLSSVFVAFDSRATALISAFVAVVVASFARYKVLFGAAGSGPDESRILPVMLIYALIASIAGGLAAHDLMACFEEDVSPTAFLGALAGLLSAIIMAMSMITFHMGRRAS